MTASVAAGRDLDAGEALGLVQEAAERLVQPETEILSNVYKGHIIRDPFWRLVNFQRKIRDRLVLRYQVLGHAIAEIRLPGVVPSQSPPCT